MKKILIVLVLLFVCSLRVDALGRHGHFSVVDKDFPFYCRYCVMLNSNEILDLGGGYNVKKRPNMPVRKYNIMTRTLTNLNSMMFYPRISYSAIKYDATHVLLVGGVCEYPYEQKSESKRRAEIYDIKKNEFTPLPNTTYEYYEPSVTLLSDGRVMVYGHGHGEFFDPKSRSFTKVPVKEGSIFITEVTPDELLFIKGGIREVLNIKTNKLTPIKVLDERARDIYITGTVKISPDTILFIGGGEDMRDVLKLDTKTKELSYACRLPKALDGTPVLLDNGEILILNGVLEGELVTLFWYSPGKSLVHSVYDYKKNKIYKRRTASYFYWNPEGVFPVENAVYILDCPKLRLYKYKKRRNKQ